MVDYPGKAPPWFFAFHEFLPRGVGGWYEDGLLEERVSSQLAQRAVLLLGELNTVLGGRDMDHRES